VCLVKNERLLLSSSEFKRVGESAGFVDVDVFHCGHNALDPIVVIAAGPDEEVLVRLAGGEIRSERRLPAATPARMKTTRSSLNKPSICPAVFSSEMKA
jgi:hypothetical protein